MELVSTMEESCSLYTVQKPGFAISLRQFPSQEFLHAGVAFHTMLFRMAQHVGPNPWKQIANHLEWEAWMGCFEDIQDYNNEWIALENVVRGDLWTLSVPYNEIRWCSLEAQCENHLPVEKWFCPYPEAIRRHGQTPQALIKFPLKASYLVKVERSRDVFQRAGLWDSRLEEALGDDGVERRVDTSVFKQRHSAEKAA